MKKKLNAASLVQLILKLLVIFAMLFPIVWSLLCSFKTQAEIFRFPPNVLPESLNLDSYQNVLDSNLPVQMWNSVKISAYTIVCTLLLASLAGYGFARSDWKGMNVLLYILIGTQMIPGLSNVITLYITGSKLGALNTHWYVALIYIASNAPTSVWLMKSYFAGIPRELDEAALVDGCTHVQAMFRITLPLVRTGMVACAILIFVNCWNEFLVAMIMLGRTKVKTYSLGLRAFMMENDISWSNVCAATMLGLLPMLTLFLSMQKSFLEGLTSGAVKS